MRQALAIFRKDALRSRAHIAVVAALTALVAILTPHHDPVYSHEAAALNRAIDLLQAFVLPLVWWLAIAHAVHAEPVAGTRQFWTTRPYSWRSLFSAKLLFCAAFLLVPFLFSDVYILRAMGFSPAPLFPELIARQFAIGAMLLLPAILFAVLTRTTRQFILTVAGATVALMILIPIAARNPANYVIDTPNGRASANGWGIALWAILAFAILLWVYAYRKIGGARLLLLALAAIAFITAAIPSRAGAPAPLTGRHPEIAVALASQHGAGVTQSGLRGKVQLDLPLQFTGRDRDLLDWNVASLAIADGRTTRFLPSNYSLVTSRKNATDAIELYLDIPDYDRFSQGPVRLDIVLGVALYDFVRRVPLPPNGLWTEVSGVGFARIHQGMPWTSVEWRTPLHYPAEKLTYRFRGEGHVDPGFELSMGHPDPQPFHMTPVVTWTVPIAHPPTTLLWSADVDVARQVDFFRRDLSIPDVRLSDWVIAR